MNHSSSHVRQPKIASLETERQTRVVEPREVQNRGLKVVDADGILHDVESRIVAAAIV